MTTNRSNNIKESKEKRNREKLLAGPGSEFSLANPEDLELDYYDYNVTNAGAAPGSFLGMDPAYLVWIPPIDDDTKYEGSDSDKDNNTVRSPLSNSTIETPIEEAPTTPSFNEKQDITSDLEKNSEVIVTNTANEISPNMKLSRLISTSTMLSSCLPSVFKPPIDSIQMIEFQSKASTLKKHQLPTNDEHEDDKDCDTEKETVIFKSSSCNNIIEYYELDDIQFADEEDDCIDFGTYTRTSQLDQRDNKDPLVTN